MSDRYILVIIIQLMILALVPEKVSCLELCVEDQEWLVQVDRLRFSEVDWEPLSYTSDYPEYKGLIADYLQLLGDTAGIEMKYIQSSTWKEVLNKFKNKEIDLIPAIDSEDDAGAKVILTDPYISFPLVIVTRPDIEFISSTLELNGKRVGVGEGYTSYNFLKNNYPNIDLVTTNNVREGLRLLNKGSIDAFVGHLAVVNDAIKKSRLDLKIAGKTEYVFEHRMGLSVEHERTVSIFNEILSGITPEEHNQIYNRWIRMNSETADYSLVWKILIGASFIFFWIVFWNRRLSAEKKHIQGLLEELHIVKNQLEAKNNELNELAITDRLTGLHNRHKLDEALKYEVYRYNRFNHTSSIILVDIDHFKVINDTYGHQEGDRILVSISQVLQANIRKTDILGRWGGEEFLIICPETDEGGVTKLAENLRKKIESYDFRVVQSITASFGVACIQSEDDMRQLVKRADDALYFAKEDGRNRVHIIN